MNQSEVYAIILIVVMVVSILVSWRLGVYIQRYEYERKRCTAVSYLNTEIRAVARQSSSAKFQDVHTLFYRIIMLSEACTVLTNSGSRLPEDTAQYLSPSFQKVVERMFK